MLRIVFRSTYGEAFVNSARRRSGPAFGAVLWTMKKDTKKIDHRPIYVLAVLYLIGAFLFLLGYWYR